MILDLAGGWLGVGIVPGGVGIFLPLAEERVVARLALPGAGGSGGAGAEVLPLERGFREIYISFDRFVGVAFGNDDAVPNCLGHDGIYIRSWFFILHEKGREQEPAPLSGLFADQP